MAVSRKSSHLGDAAAAIVITDKTWAEKHGVAATAGLVAYGIAQLSPACAASDPFRRSNKHCSVPDGRFALFERIEINEAFSAIAIVVAGEIQLPDNIVSVEGGAVAHGHPIRATGDIARVRNDPHPLARRCAERCAEAGSTRKSADRETTARPTLSLQE